MKLSVGTVFGLLVAANAASLAPDAVQQILGLGASSESGQPNFIFVITDDQDLKLDSIDYMPLTLKHLKQKGTFFRNHFVTTALCCPSRVSLWTGRQAHNTNVTDVSPPYGALSSLFLFGLL
jgi:arylsulfatase A-like enzyme